jgi:hypothetical protein
VSKSSIYFKYYIFLWYYGNIEKLGGFHMFYRSSSVPSQAPEQGLPPDALVIVIPKVWLDRLFLLAVIALLAGGAASIQVFNLSGSSQIHQTTPRR